MAIKSVMIIIFLLSISISVMAQVLDLKMDNTWLFGPVSQSVVFDFNNDSLMIDSFPRIISLSETNSVYCDTSGVLQLYTNGCHIMGANHDTINNGGKINNVEGDFSWDNFCDDDPTTSNGYLYSNCLLFLPFDENNVSLIHVLLEINSSSSVLFKKILRTDIIKQNGVYEVTQKNKEFISLPLQDDTKFLNRGLSAIRHGNGRDWWLIIPEVGTNNYYKFVVQQDTILGPFIQSIGPPFESVNDVLGQVTFSPDGTHLAVHFRLSYTRLFDFNRCSGALSNTIYLPMNTGFAEAGGVSFSSNSQYLYRSTATMVEQFDIWANDVEASRILVGEYDSFQLGSISTWFGVSKLGGDGKIYISGLTTGQYMHTIELPDSAGLACDFQQRKYMLPATGRGFPNTPVYNLGVMEGSDCDSLTTAVEEVSDVVEDIQVFPNPTTGELIIQSPFINEEFSILNALGQVVYSGVIDREHFKIDLRDEPSGLYYFTVGSETRKFLLIR